MLLPVLHSLLLWWTSCLMECHGAFLGILVLSLSETLGRIARSDLGVLLFLCL